MNKKNYRHSNVTRQIAELNSSFELACDAYRTALRTRPSNRAAKELGRGNVRGTSIYRFQCNFAWLLYDIEHDAIHFIDKNIYRAKELIKHIHSIANV